MAKEIDKAFSNVINKVIQNELVTILDNTLPDQGNTMLDMIDDLTRPGSFINWVRRNLPQIKILYETIPNHKLNNKHVVFAEFTFILWFSFHNIEVDLAFST